MVLKLRWHIPNWVTWLYLATSMLAFIAYWLDKRAARNGQWRITERTLLLLGLAGGWPGAYVAQRLFRHKTSKWTFVALFRASVVLNLAALIFLHYPRR